MDPITAEEGQRRTPEDFLAEQGITEETLAGDYAEVVLAMINLEKEYTSNLEARVAALLSENTRLENQKSELFMDLFRAKEKVKELEEENTKLKGLSELLDSSNAKLSEEKFELLNFSQLVKDDVMIEDNQGLLWDNADLLLTKYSKQLPLIKNLT